MTPLQEKTYQGLSDIFRQANMYWARLQFPISGYWPDQKPFRNGYQTRLHGLAAQKKLDVAEFPSLKDYTNFLSRYFGSLSDPALCDVITMNNGEDYFWDNLWLGEDYGRLLDGRFDDPKAAPPALIIVRSHEEMKPNPSKNWQRFSGHTKNVAAGNKAIPVKPVISCGKKEVTTLFDRARRLDQTLLVAARPFVKKGPYSKGYSAYLHVANLRAIARIDNKYFDLQRPPAHQYDLLENNASPDGV